jgi:hypothetical protein
MKAKLQAPCHNCRALEMVMVPRCDECHALLEDGFCPVCRSRLEPAWFCQECSRWI